MLMEGGIAQAVKEAELSSDDLVQKVEKAIEDSIRKEKEGNSEAEIPTELIRDKDVYSFLVNPANYTTNPEISEEAPYIYVGFVLRQSMKGATKKMPIQMTRDAVLDALKKSTLPRMTNPRLLENVPGFLERDFNNYLTSQGYKNYF